MMNFRVDLWQEKTHMCVPKMACREECDINWRGICDHTCRYSFGHPGQFHMCDPLLWLVDTDDLHTDFLALTTDSFGPFVP